MQTRTHNAANELGGWTGTGGAGGENRIYDDAGNLLEIQVGVGVPVVRLRYDAWHRLVRVQRPNASGVLVTVAEYEYNALHHKVVSREDTAAMSVGAAGAASGAVPDGVLDRETRFSYSPDWQVLERRVDYTPGDGTFTATELFLHFYGGRGPNDVVFTRRDGGPSGTIDGLFDNRVWYVTDARFSVVAEVDDAGAVLGRWSYDSYGRPTLAPFVASSGGLGRGWDALGCGSGGVRGRVPRRRACG